VRLPALDSHHFSSRVECKRSKPTIYLLWPLWASIAKAKAGNVAASPENINNSTNLFSAEPFRFSRNLLPKLGARKLVVAEPLQLPPWNGPGGDLELTNPKRETYEPLWLCEKSRVFAFCFLRLRWSFKAPLASRAAREACGLGSG
jgi:hypothetical protein